MQNSKNESDNTQNTSSNEVLRQLAGKRIRLVRDVEQYILNDPQDKCFKKGAEGTAVYELCGAGVSAIMDGYVSNLPDCDNSLFFNNNLFEYIE